MEGKPELDKTTLHWVRNVAPKKDMYCISFPLSSELAFANPNEKRKIDQFSTTIEESINTSKTNRTE